MEQVISSGNGTILRIVKGVVFLAIAAVLIYYLYDYLFNTTAVQKKADLLPSNPVSSPAALTISYPTDPSVKLNQYIYTGGEMAVSFWMYVTGIQSTDMTKKHILHLGTSETDENPTLSIAFGPASSNGLFIHVKTLKDTTTNGYSLFMGPGGDTDLSKPCNLSNIEFGRWVNVTVVLNNNLCDVYMDGKLSRSCVLDSQFQVDSQKPLFFYLLKPSFGSPAFNTLWKGSLTNAVFYNYALSPDAIYRIYMAGPGGASGDLLSAIKSFFGFAKTYTPAIPTAGS